MTFTTRIAHTLRGVALAGLIGAATVGLSGAAHAAVLPPAPGAHAVTATAFSVHRSVRAAGDYDDEDGGGGGGGGDSAEQPTYDAPEQQADVAPEPPADNGSIQPSADDPVEDDGPQVPAATPAEEPPAQDPATEPPAEEPQDPAPAAPDAPAADAPAAPEAPAPAQEPTPAQAPAPEAPAAPETPAAPEAPAAPEPAPDAPTPSDVTAAQRSAPVEVNAPAASAATVEELRTEILTQMTSTTSVTSAEWNREVTQWNTSWVSYDEYYRPVLLNPYRTPLQLVYTYGNASRIVTVNPLSRVVLDVPDAGVYNFTALLRSPAGAVTDVSVGSFAGGGFVPAAGKPRPVKPVTPPTFDNVLVRLQYTDGSSQPFRVKHLADLGDDAAVHARRVLIDGTTSAWGQWTRTAGGEREFDITKTLQLPGLAGPAQAPLPGYPAASQKH